MVVYDGDCNFVVGEVKIESLETSFAKEEGGIGEFG